LIGTILLRDLFSHDVSIHSCASFLFKRKKRAQIRDSKRIAVIHFKRAQHLLSAFRRSHQQKSRELRANQRIPHPPSDARIRPEDSAKGLARRARSRAKGRPSDCRGTVQQPGQQSGEQRCGFVVDPWWIRVAWWSGSLWLVSTRVRAYDTPRRRSVLVLGGLGALPRRSFDSPPLLSLSLSLSLSLARARIAGCGFTRGRGTPFVAPVLSPLPDPLF